MSLPKQLIDSFTEIKKSRAVQNDFSEDALQEFASILNRAIPSPLNSSAYAVYRFNRFKYLANKDRFIADIKDFQPYDSLILWTDFGNILEYFNLKQKFFLGWDKMKNKYRACPLLKNRQKQTSDKSCNDVVKTVVNDIVDKVAETVSNEEKNATELNNAKSIDNLETLISDMESDDDVVFNRMAEAVRWYKLSNCIRG